MNLAVPIPTTTHVIQVNPLLAGIVMLGVFYLYWFAAKRPLTKIYEVVPNGVVYEGPPKTGP